MMADSRNSLQTELLEHIEPSTQKVPGAFTSKIKRPGRKADYTPCAKVKNQWSYTSTTPYALCAQYSNSYRIPFSAEREVWRGVGI